MARYPTLPLHTDAWIADTREMSLLARGAYMDLLIYAWRSPDCCLPDDDARLARMLGISRYQWSRIKGEVMAFWTLEPVDKSVDNLGISVWRQRNLTRNRIRIAKKSAIRSAAAKQRWHDKSLINKDSADANASANGEQNDGNPDPYPYIYTSSSSIDLSTTGISTDDDEE